MQRIESGEALALGLPEDQEGSPARAGLTIPGFKPAHWD